MQVKVTEGKVGTCGCGRSPTGDCIGWHGLNEQQLKEAQLKWEQSQNQNDNKTLQEKYGQYGVTVQRL